MERSSDGLRPDQNLLNCIKLQALGFFGSTSVLFTMYMSLVWAFPVEPVGAGCCCRVFTYSNGWKMMAVSEPLRKPDNIEFFMSDMVLFKSRIFFISKFNTNNGLILLLATYKCYIYVRFILKLILSQICQKIT